MTPSAAASAEHVDVLIVGAGISGIGAAYHLQTQCPDKSFVVLDALDSFGGTWLTHRYPGVRSDSDLFTFGYRFKPWHGAPIATAREILGYLGEVIAENKLAHRMRYRHRILRASWSGPDKLWTLEVLRSGTGIAPAHTVRFTTRFLWMCQGYYRHDQGYTPAWPGMARFAGQIIHPQTWSDEVALAGKRVVVIGSGATAATVVPHIAGRCAHVTMLQRSPTYFITGRNANELADTLRQLDIPAEWTHEIVRRKILHDQAHVARRCVTEPAAITKELLAGVRQALGPGLEHLVGAHFTPSYRPWQQRIAFVPDGDLFKGIREGKTSVVTDHIRHFVENGIQLDSGQVLEADIVVTATGFDLNVLGDIEFTIDGAALDFHDCITYRGALFTGIPNLAWVFGYFRASWTLRADLLGDFVCRLLRHMDAKGHQVVVPTLRPDEQHMDLKPWVEPDNFNPGYLARSLDQLPRQGDRMPWQHPQDYATEKTDLPQADLDDGALRFD